MFQFSTLKNFFIAINLAGALRGDSLYKRQTTTHHLQIYEAARDRSQLRNYRGTVHDAAHLLLINLHASLF